MLDRSKTDYPQGDGRPDCPKCKGRGAIDTVNRFGIDAAITCDCTHERDLRDNMERAWKGLSQVAPPKKSPLIGLEGGNLWITASKVALQGHLHALAQTKGRLWFFKVITDVDLLDSWLPKKHDILDPDVALARHVPTDRYTVLTDLTEPPDLLIIRLGVKAARNVAAPEVLLEALLHRDQHGKPTWIVDSDSSPFMAGHISYDERVAEHIEGWKRVTLEVGGGTVRRTSKVGVRMMGLPGSGNSPVATRPSSPSAPPADEPSSNQGGSRLDRLALTAEERGKDKKGSRGAKGKWRGGFGE